MFASAGYFRGLNCPYFGSGLCERPYCHFRHVKDLGGKSDEKTNTGAGNTLDGPPTGPTSKTIRTEPVSDDFGFQKNNQNGQTLSVEYNRYAGEPINNTKQEQRTSSVLPSTEINKYTGEPVKQPLICKENGTSRYKEQIHLNGGVQFNKYTGEPILDSAKSEQYIAEHVARPKVVEFNRYTGKPVYRNEKSGSTPLHSNKHEGSIPSYEPTPLHELQKRPTNKYILASHNDVGDDEEYDPESNYSTAAIGGYKNTHTQVKRTHSYDPSNASYGKSSKKLKSEFQFDISEFSDDDEDNNDEETEEKSRFGEKFEEDGDDDGFQVKGAKYFENLLDRRNSADSDVSEEPGKYFFSDTTEKSTSLVDRFKSANDKININKKSSKSIVKSTDGKLMKEKLDLEKLSKSENKLDKDAKALKRSLSVKSQDEKLEHKKLKETKNSENLKDKISLKDKKVVNDKVSSSNHKSDSSSNHKSDSSSNHKSKSSNHHKSDLLSKHSLSSSSHKSSSHHKLSSSGHKLSTDHESPSSSHASSSNHKLSSVSHKSSDSHKSSSGHHKSSSGSHKTSSSHKSSSINNSSSGSHKSSDTQKSSSSTSNNKSSSSQKLSSGSHKSSSHSSHKSEKEDTLKNNKLEKSERTTENDQESKRKRRKSSSEDSERRKSIEENARKKILNLNVDLFGEDSDSEAEITNHDADAGYSSDSSHGDFLTVGSDIELSDTDTYDECFRIFKETNSSLKDHKKAAKKKKLLDENSESGTSTTTAKKRKAHAAETEIKRKLREAPISKLSPAQVMHNRFLHIQQKALKEAAIASVIKAAVGKADIASTSSPSSSSSAPLSNSSSVKGKKSSVPTASASTSSSTKTSKKKSEPEKFVMTTASKSEKRKAHVPDVIKTNLKRPTIPSEFGSKVPVNVRQRYLNLIIDECLKLCDNEEDAYKRGQDEEQAVYSRSSSRKVYLNVVINAIKKLRTEISQKSTSKAQKDKASPLKITHETILGGKNATKTTFTLNRSGGGAKIITENFKGVELYNRLSKYVLTEEQLKENGFPFPSPDNPGSAIFYTDKGAQMSQKTTSHRNPIDYEKICLRCGKRFIVYPNGKYAHEEECNYHWGKAWKKRVAGVIDTRYTCCQGDFNSDGCQFAKQHVHETNKYENLSGYMKTLPCSPPPDGDYGVYAMDCEMVYTLAGIELARVTVVDQSNEPIYESLVKPDRKIIDYNTKFSGITEEDMKGVTTSLRDVQAVLLSLFTDNTIIIGHSLESDLAAVKLIHKTVVDTSVVFPHRLGPPYKRALKTLMAEYMQKIIQDDVGGHDSLEDAVSCMDLMHYQIREDARRDKRS